MPPKGPISIGFDIPLLPTIQEPWLPLILVDSWKQLWAVSLFVVVTCQSVTPTSLLGGHKREPQVGGRKAQETSCKIMLNLSAWTGAAISTWFFSVQTFVVVFVVGNVCMVEITKSNIVSHKDINSLDTAGSSSQNDKMVQHIEVMHNFNWATNFSVKVVQKTVLRTCFEDKVWWIEFQVCFGCSHLELFHASFWRRWWRVRARPSQNPPALQRTS